MLNYQAGIIIYCILFYASVVLVVIWAYRRRKRRRQTEMHTHLMGVYPPQRSQRKTPQVIYQEYEDLHQVALDHSSEAALLYMQSGPIPDALNGRIVLGAPIYPAAFEPPVAPLHAQVMRREKIVRILQVLSRR
ncbi:hypothetical protein KDA_48860 [Dictyobacter alpinus]|uniref:Uncharacterized protein n=1 Tax=Dictyobacter alpinus TaxID=2014873 RepID=A0A402BDN1_9CHLR|nr:hypothetical protein [Dictyobacter alpinus]GCE29402.1 hypothetical protein KDA_48860 [Dictyobacter alpinus]